MQLVEKHLIKKGHQFFDECNNLCFLSKNLYNSTLFNIRKHYFESKKYLNLKDSYHLIKNSTDYKNLPAKISNQVIKLVDKNFKSFFSLLKNKEVKNRIPKYLDKNGKFITIYEKGAISVKSFKSSGNIKLSKTNIEFHTKVNNFKDIDQVRIVPRVGYYVIEVVYTIPDKQLKMDNKKYGSIDIGLNNLATVTFNDGSKPLIFNGRPLKSINQYFNKKKSDIQSKLEKINKVKKSKRINKLNLKRTNKINDYLHKTSKKLVNHLVSNNINTLVIGKNDNWKQDINIGRVNNQNFVQIPHYKFIEMLKYKCKIEGINIILQEESYTSKCSFLDNEDVKKQQNYLGKRIKRGLFKTSTGKLINADVNGSYNIMKKAIPDVFKDGIEGLSVNPIKINI
jgi:putative transposase